MRRVLLVLALLAGGPAWAQRGGEMVLSGTAQINAGTHPVRFRFMCTPSVSGGIGVLGVQLEVPGYAGLRGFPFDAFEGPDADAGQLTRLEATGAGATAQGMFAASGWERVGPDRPFVLGLAAARQGEPTKLLAVGSALRQLRDGPARLVWRQGVPTGKQGGLVASVALAAADATHLQTLIAPCLKDGDFATAGLRPIRFAAGASAATVEGGVVRGDRDDYVITANQGQTMTVRIASVEKNAVFQLFGPGAAVLHNDDGQAVEGVALRGAGDGEDATAWSGVLPASGRYLIVVGGTRGNAAYRLTVAVK